MGCNNSAPQAPAGAGADEPVAPRPRKRRGSVSAECAGDAAAAYEKVVHEKDDATKERIRASVAANFLFSSLDEGQANDVIDAMFNRTVSAGDVVIQQGDDGDNFYVVESGEYEVFIAGKEDPVFHYASGGSFGELALMYNTPRAATVKAKTDGVLWALDRQTFRHIILRANQLKAERYTQWLEGIDLFANMSVHEKARVADALASVTFAPDDIIIRQGDNSRDDFRFFIVEEGTCGAFVDKDGQEWQVGTMGPGQFFGEKALIEKRARAATVRPIGGPCKCVAMDVATFERIMGPCREIMQRTIAAYKTVEQVQAEAKDAGQD